MSVEEEGAAAARTRKLKIGKHDQASAARRLHVVQGARRKPLQEGPVVCAVDAVVDADAIDVEEVPGSMPRMLQILAFYLERLRRQKSAQRR
jgi:hypothetical protein